MHKPRSILKAIPEPDPSGPPIHESFSSSHPLPFAASSKAVMYSPHVHFPTPGRLTLTGDTHSPGSYDRAPIESPLSCVRPISSYFHPRAFEACELDVPALHPDLSSETDESTEECVSPTMSPEPPVAIHVHGTPYPTPMPIRRTHSQEEFDRALSFLPHPPVPIADRDVSQKRRCSPRRPRRSVAFQEPPEDCDNCLGGF
ncbi:hypothetical protein R3P38DRAFT_2819492 [Favolaschia claudopus]|uniref:Uncharacterized protein n=1 Tax=Favolaschia claudopus TaxID=2862362 RepID=A0AAW0EFL5_9AGAR